VGDGLPLAVARKRIAEPMDAITFVGCCVNSGGVGGDVTIRLTGALVVNPKLFVMNTEIVADVSTFITATDGLFVEPAIRMPFRNHR